MRFVKKSTWKWVKLILKITAKIRKWMIFFLFVEPLQSWCSIYSTFITRSYPFCKVLWVIFSAGVVWWEFKMTCNRIYELQVSRKDSLLCINKKPNMKMPLIDYDVYFIFIARPPTIVVHPILKQEYKVWYNTTAICKK